MAYRVKRFSGEPDFEMLEAAVLFNFPLEKRDYKPYSQARVCIAQGGLYLQFHSFESQPPDGSAMVASFYFPPSSGTLAVRIEKSGNNSVVWHVGDDKTREAPGASVHMFDGEDLQGVYWGADVFVGLDSALMDALCPGADFLGNFYKLCENEAHPHYGCFYPADFKKPLYAQENMGGFTVINY